MKRWYVVQVYAGYEEAVKADLLKRIQEKNLQDSFGDILVSSSSTKLRNLFEVADAKDQQLFPGYILVEMEVSPETVRLVISNSRVLRFLGGQHEPVPLTQKEIDRVISQIKGEIAIVSEKNEFITGSDIEISEGPFAGFMGIVDKVDKDSERLTVMVSIFGRMTPVELNFDQVKR
ncbi:MAG: transcription termination/antitermination protein NusG [Candidatus Dependentiae bacterium]|nr:transcription termination/antitermination protein NusG [Candidatus Dependentiae bacterium]